MSKFKSYREESRLDYGVTNGNNPNIDQLQAGALFRIADELEAYHKWGSSSNLCSIPRSLIRIVNSLEKGLTIRHEHSLTFKLHWSIRWPWQQKARRRQWTWRLFKGKAKK